MATLQQIIAIQKQANQLLHEHGLWEQGWTFKLSSSTRRVAVCKHNLKRIEYSAHYLNAPAEEVTDTLLHEIAHALVGPGMGHNYAWKAKCREIGAKPERLASEETSQATTAKPNYRWKCEVCGWHADRFRLKRHLIENALCPRCKSRGIQSILKAYKLTYKPK